MIEKKPLPLLLMSLGTLSLSVGLVATTPAQMPHDPPQPAVAARANRGLQPIYQPLWLKLTVAGVGMGLIGLELWWFLWSRPQAHLEDGIE